MRSITSAVILIVFSIPGFAEVIPATREVLLDNQTVEIVRLTYPVGSESGMHTHEYPHRAAYVVKGGTLEMIPADSQKPHQVIEIPDGDALFLPASSHNVKNIGDTEIIIIETEIKLPSPTG